MLELRRKTSPMLSTREITDEGCMDSRPHERRAPEKCDEFPPPHGGLLGASGVERISAAAESNKRQRTADDRHILHEMLELIQIAKLRVPDES